MSTLAERIDYILKTKGISAAELARKAGVSRTAISLYRSGETQNIKADAAIRIAQAYDVSFQWLIEGTGGPDSDKITVLDDDVVLTDDDPVFALPILRSVTMKDGPNGPEPSFDDTDGIDYRFYDRAWFKAHGYEIKALRCVKVSDSGMERTLYKGDSAMVDTLDRTQIENRCVYAISVNGVLRVRRLVADLRGDITVFSDNSEYYKPEIFRRDDQSAAFIVVGKVIYRSGSGGL